MNNDERETLARVSRESGNLVFSDLPTSCLSLRMANERLRLTWRVKRRATSAKVAKEKGSWRLGTVRAYEMEEGEFPREF